MKEPVYDNIARFYDRVLGSSKEPAAYIKNIILKHNKSAHSILELGCGTGSNLAKLRNYEVSGIDISRAMLAIAKKKIPEGEYFVKDIRNFRLRRTFDVILCLYDTINHMTLFSDWKKIFVNAYEHLNDRGLFIFDVNTLYKLEGISLISPVINTFDSNYLLVDVRKISKTVFNWNLKIFEMKKRNNFELYETNIKEAGFEAEKIYGELSKLFKIKAIDDESGKKYRANSERIYFVCQKII